MTIRRRTIHVTADGRRLLVDAWRRLRRRHALRRHAGAVRRLAVLPHPHRQSHVQLPCVARLGLRYWSLSEFLKRRSGAAERYIARFVQAGFDDAKRRGLDGIICGHIHRAALLERDGRVYANDGDWVESLTALAEDPDGTLRLLAHTGETIVSLSPRASRQTPHCLPQAA